MQNQTRGYDWESKSGDCKRKSKTKRGSRIGALKFWFAVNKEKTISVRIIFWFLWEVSEDGSYGQGFLLK